jgi:hypothetical protein
VATGSGDLPERIWYRSRGWQLFTRLVRWPGTAVAHRHRSVPQPDWASWFSRITLQEDEHCRAGFEELAMKLRLLVVAASAVLLLAPRTANAMGPQGQPDSAISGSAQMQRNANESAQATTDMSLGETWHGTETGAQGAQNVSYGGVAAGQAQTGGRHGQACGSGPQCKIYFGQ